MALVLSHSAFADEPANDELIHRWQAWCRLIANDYSVKGKTLFAKQANLPSQINYICRDSAKSAYKIEYNDPHESPHGLVILVNESYCAKLAAKSTGKWAATNIALASSPEYQSSQLDVDAFEKWLNPGRISRYLSEFKFNIEQLKQDAESRVLRAKIDPTSISRDFRRKVNNLVLSEATFTFDKSHDWLPIQIDLEYDVSDQNRDAQTAMRVVFSDWISSEKSSRIPSHISVFQFKKPAGDESPITEFYVTDYKRFGSSDEPYCSLVGYGLPEIGDRGKSTSSRWWLGFALAGFAIITAGFLMRKRFVT